MRNFRRKASPPAAKPAPQPDRFERKMAILGVPPDQRAAFRANVEEAMALYDKLRALDEEENDG